MRDGTPYPPRFAGGKSFKDGNIFRKRKRTGLLSLVVVLVLIDSVAVAVTRRDDVSDDLYLALGADYPCVGYVDRVGVSFTSGVLIAPHWVLTAAHVLYADVVEVVFAQRYDDRTPENTCGAAGTIVHPNWGGSNTAYEGWDLGLIRLSRPPLDITPVPRYTGSAELGQVGTWVGFGRTGDGYSGGTITDRTRRGALNVIDRRGNTWDSSWSRRVLLADFDSPHPDSINRMGSTQPEDREGGIAFGDSGGGLFVEPGGVRYLAGIHSFVIQDEAPPGKYNGVMGATGLSALNGWIDGVIADNADTLEWNNPGGGSFDDHANWNAARLDYAMPIEYDTVYLAETGGSPLITFPGEVTNKQLIVPSGETILDLQGHTYTLTHAGSDPAVQVGNQLGGNAQLTIRDGMLKASNVQLGLGSGSNGKLVVEDGAGATLEGLVVGRDGRGAFSQHGGINTLSGNLVLGWSPGSEGTCTISGGMLDVADASIEVGPAGTGQFNLIAGLVTAEQFSVGSNGTFHVELSEQLLALTARHVVLNAGSTLNLQAVGVNRAEIGTTVSRTIITADGPSGAIGAFDNVPPVHDPLVGPEGHLGLGVFHRGVNYVGRVPPDDPTKPAASVSVDLFVARGGDGNGDGAVDVTDITNLVANFGTKAGFNTWLENDTGGGTPGRGDGRVDTLDIIDLVANFGKGISPDPGPGAVPPGLYEITVVPEPGTVAMLVFGGLFGLLLLLRRRRRAV